MISNILWTSSIVFIWKSKINCNDKFKWHWSVIESTCQLWSTSLSSVCDVESFNATLLQWTMVTVIYIDYSTTVIYYVERCKDQLPWHKPSNGSQRRESDSNRDAVSSKMSISITQIVLIKTILFIKQDEIHVENERNSPCLLVAFCFSMAEGNLLPKRQEGSFWMNSQTIKLFTN